MLMLAKVILAACVIAFASWLSEKKPEVAGFIIALPLASLLALIFSYFEYRDPQASIQFARSILVGVPVSYLFFLPFFLAEKFDFDFVAAYLIGLGLLVVGFFIHQYMMKTFF